MKAPLTAKTADGVAGLFDANGQQIATGMKYENAAFLVQALTLGNVMFNALATMTEIMGSMATRMAEAQEKPLEVGDIAAALLAQDLAANLRHYLNTGENPDVINAIARINKDVTHVGPKWQTHSRN